jgi:hypothetical protein
MDGVREVGRAEQRPDVLARVADFQLRITRDERLLALGRSNVFVGYSVYSLSSRHGWRRVDRTNVNLGTGRFVTAKKMDK